MAKDKYGLTTNQRAFADEYIRNKGNATKAYFFAYPHTKNEGTAAASGARLLRNVKVSSYIADRTKELLEKAKMGQDEIIVTLTSVARREIQTSYSKVYDHLSKEVVKETTYTFQPSIEESTKALEVLVKFLGNPVENERVKIQIEKIKLDMEKTRAEIERIRGIAEEIEELEDIEEEIYGSKED